MKLMKTILMVFTTALELLALSCQQNKPAQVLEIIDASRSVSSAVPAALGVADHSTQLKGVRRKSTISFMATGNKQTAGEPVWLGSFPILKAHKVMEGQSNEPDNAELLGQVEGLLRGLKNTKSISPIYLAVRRGVQYLRAQGCGPGPAPAVCYLVVITDGEETEESAIRKALHGAGNFEPPKNLMIDNTGIAVEFCGLSGTNEITPERNSTSAERLETVWINLFKVPPAFSPFCRQKAKGD
jgi:hypothetical protein